MFIQLLKLALTSHLIDGVEIPRTPATSAQLRDVLQIAFIAAGGVSTIFVAIGGLKYVLSGGNPQETAKAKETVLYALIGLIISALALVIVVVVTRLIQG
jgi:hypothetical protein